MFTLKQIDFYEKAEGKERRYLYSFETEQTQKGGILKAKMSVTFVSIQDWIIGYQYDLADIFRG